MKTALVVPTARPEQIVGFLRVWRREPFDHVLLVEDSAKATQDLGAGDDRVQVYS
jgi:hypothetical protein